MVIFFGFVFDPIVDRFTVLFIFSFIAGFLLVFLALEDDSTMVVLAADTTVFRFDLLAVILFEE